MVDRLRIIQDYGALMERNPPLPTRIEDVSVLPHPKAAILDALIFEIGQEHPKHIDDMLRFGAISLAQYQRDVGREPLEMLGTDARNLPRKLAEQKHLAEVLSKMQDRFKKFDELAQTDLRLINGKIATVDAQKQTRQYQMLNVIDPTRIASCILTMHYRLLAIGMFVGKLSAGVGDDELHAVEAAVDEVAQERRPAGLVLLGALADAQNLSKPSELTALATSQRDIADFASPGPLHHDAIERCSPSMRRFRHASILA